MLYLSFAHNDFKSWCHWQMAEVLKHLLKTKQNLWNIWTVYLTSRIFFPSRCDYAWSFRWWYLMSGTSMGLKTLSIQRFTNGISNCYFHIIVCLLHPCAIECEWHVRKSMVVLSVNLIRSPRSLAMRIWHWKSQWKVQVHWNAFETTLKRFTKDIITVKFSL